MKIKNLIIIAGLLLAITWPVSVFAEIGDTYFKKGNDFFKAKKYDKAIEMYGKAYEINKEHLGAVYNLALCYQEKGRLKEAAGYFEKAIELDTTYTQARIGLGIVYTRQGRYEDAINVYKGVIDADERSYIGHLNLAAVYAKKEAYKEAIEEAKKALKINPTEPNGHLLLGNIYFVIKQYDNSIEEYEWILKIEPKNIFARLHAGMAYAEKGDYDAAVKNISAAANYTKDFGYIHFYLGKVYLNRYEKTGGEIEPAMRELKKAVQINPDLIEAYVEIGRAYEMKKDNKTALKYYMRYVDSPYAKEEQKQEALNVIAQLRERIRNENISPKLPVNPDIKDAKKK